MDTRMEEYIMVVLKSRLTIMWSWGSSRFTPVENGLMWFVRGYLFTGWVKVVYNVAHDTFDVYLLKNRQEVIKKVADVYLDNLVDVIDYHVEKNDSFDYEKRVRDTYSLL